MSKKKTEQDDLTLLQAKHDALADQMVDLETQVSNLQMENKDLHQELDALRSKQNEIVSSVSIAPAPAPPPVKPVVVIGGQQYQFKVAEFRVPGIARVFNSAEIAADEMLLSQTFEKYPGLFRKIEE